MTAFVSNLLSSIPMGRFPIIALSLRGLKEKRTNIESSLWVARA